ncbi:hypothetical protein AAZX31_04G155700 [Glycine max]|nr:hypothetical protein GLYMA_04G171101v4 [Glycine max]KAH1111789.1 hypothetical protein GYH30_010226 [Glycine max]
MIFRWRKRSLVTKSLLHPSGLSRSAKYGLAIGVGIPGLLCLIGISCCICGKLTNRPHSVDSIRCSLYTQEEGSGAGQQKLLDNSRSRVSEYNHRMEQHRKFHRLYFL